jgi:hypothetical protein
MWRVLITLIQRALIATFAATQLQISSGETRKPDFHLFIVSRLRRQNAPWLKKPNKVARPNLSATMDGQS